MDRIEILNKFWDHFIVSCNPRSVADDGSKDCLYVGPGDTGCAVGILLSKPLRAALLCDASLNRGSVERLISERRSSELSLQQRAIMRWAHDELVLGMSAGESESGREMFLVKLQKYHDETSYFDKLGNDITRDAFYEGMLSVPWEP